MLSHEIASAPSSDDALALIVDHFRADRAGRAYDGDGIGGFGF